MKNLNKKSILIIVALLILAVAGIYIWQDKQQQTAQVVRPTNSVNYDGPSEEEIKAGEIQKETNKAREDADNNTTPPATAEIVLVDAGQYESVVEVRAYIANIYDDAGTCSVTFSKDGQQITRTNQAFKDAKTTQCGAFKVNRSEFPTAGNWQLQVSYNSAASTGSITKEMTLK